VTDTTENPIFLEPIMATEPEPEPEPWIRPGEKRGKLSPAKIRELSEHYEEFVRNAQAKGFKSDSLLDGVQKIYSTAQAAAFLGYSPQWIYWGLRNEVFEYKDGTLILPETVGKMKRRRFTLPIIREIAMSHFRRGNLTEEELNEVMKRVLLAEFGPEAFSDTK
jgi:hypothetical protein